GDVAKFPFVEPPPGRAIADGYQLLAELNAVDTRNELTPIGHELAKLPLDPRLRRMLLAAREQQCLRELLVIAAALSVQDARERPLEAQDGADNAHRRFADDKSDFLSLVKLWTFVQDKIDHKKSNRKLTDELRSHFISPRRVREWIDVHTQLATIASEHGWRVNPSPATFEQVHVALLAGLLGNIGTRIADAERGEPPYAGARGIKFFIWPGSALLKKAGRWIVAAELVETSRLYARTIATIEPGWIERVGAHLLKKSHTDPHWEKKRAEVVAFERATLYGLVVYAQRRVAFGPIDAAQARNLFIREALVEGEFETRAPFLSHNLRLIRQIRELEHKTRRLDVLVDDELIFAFYERLIPPDVNTRVDFEHWRVNAEHSDLKLLFLSRDEVMKHQAAGITTDLFPKQIALRGIGGELRLALDYHFEPGSPRDGVTMTVPLIALNQVDAEQGEWLVPGMLKEKVHVLIKSIPQKLRRHLLPLPDYAAAFVERAGSQTAQSLIGALITDIRSERGLVCQAADFKRESLPPHLQMNFKVVDDQGRQLAMGRNLAQLRSELGGQARATFQRVVQRDETASERLKDRIVDWDFGELPDVLEFQRDGQALVGYPALVDHVTHCSIEVFDTPTRAGARHRAGLRRIFRLQLKDQVKFLEKGLSSLQMTQVRASTVRWLSAALPSYEELREQIVTAALDRTCLVLPLPTDRPSFIQRKEDARGKLTLIAQELARLVAAIVEQAGTIARKLPALKALPRLVPDVEQQLSQLFTADFIVGTPPLQLAQFPRYLKAIELRMDKAKGDPARDTARTNDVQALVTPWQRAISARRGVSDPRLDEFRWLLEELRVSLFAQELKTPMPVSVKRLQKFWGSANR
ncbi:MAG: ATP-dependent RNA helicase HrpA, partial [Burkholderiaceae bacterium]